MSELPPGWPEDYVELPKEAIDKLRQEEDKLTRHGFDTGRLGPRLDSVPVYFVDGKYYINGHAFQMPFGRPPDSVTLPRPPSPPKHGQCYTDELGRLLRYDAKDAAWNEVRPAGSKFPRWDIEEVDEEGFTAEERQVEEATRICIYCGRVCESLEALAEHEEDCA